MPQYLENYILAIGGFLFHLLKMWLTSVNRKENFITKPTLIWVGMNLVAGALLIYIGERLPADLIVMSPLTCVIIGVTGSSMLAGFINVKRPKDLEITTIETQRGTTTTTIEKQTTTPKGNL